MRNPLRRTRTPDAVLDTLDGWARDGAGIDPAPEYLDAWENAERAVTLARQLDDTVERADTIRLEGAAYAAGMGGNTERWATDTAAYYLGAYRGRGPRLAALVLAGYTGTPRDHVSI